MTWVVLICTLAFAGCLAYASCLLWWTAPQALRLGALRNPLLRRVSLDLATSFVLMSLMGVFFIIAGLDIARNLIPKKVVRPGQPIPKDIKRVLEEHPIWDSEDIILTDLDKTLPIRFIMDARRHRIPLKGVVGEFSSPAAYWRLERASLETGDTQSPLEVTTPQKASWPEAISEPFPDDQMITAEVKGYVDISKALPNKSLPCRVVLTAAYPQYHKGKRYRNATQVLQFPFSILVLSEPDRALVDAWKEYDRYQDILSTRRGMWWIFPILGSLTLVTAWWFHVSARSLRRRME